MPIEYRKTSELPDLPDPGLDDQFFVIHEVDGVKKLFSVRAANLPIAGPAGPTGPPGEAPLDSPAFTGIPTAPTADLGTDSDQIATTAFVLANAGGGVTLPITESDVTGLVADLALKAPLASPVLTGTPTAPTAAPGTDSTQLATTAFVIANAGTGGVTLPIAESDVTNLTTDLAAKAPLASPALTGTPTAPTAGSGTNTTQVATTAFVQDAVVAAGGGTVTHTVGALTADVLVVGNGGGDVKALSGPLISAEIAGGTGTTSPLTLKATTGVGTTGADIIFAVGNNGATEVMRVQNNGNVGIGGAPSFRFHIKGTTSNSSNGATERNSNSAGGPRWSFLKDRVGAIVQASDFIGSFLFQGWDGAIYQTAASVDVIVDGAPSVNAVPGRFVFSTAPVGGGSALERMRIDNAGHVGIGVTTVTAMLHLMAGTATAGTAPIKFTSGPLLTTPEAGAQEFLTDDFFATITTGAARKAFVLDDGARLTSGRVPFATTNGRLTDASTLTFISNVLKVTGVYYAPLIDHGNSGTAITIDLAGSNEHLVTETGSATITLTNEIVGARYVLIFATGAGGFTPTLPAGVRLGSSPTWTTAASKYDVVTMLCVAAGVFLADVALGK